MKLFRLIALVALSTSLTGAASGQSIKSTIHFNYGALGIATNPLTNKVYAVAPAGYGVTTDNLAVIDGDQDAVTANIAVPVGASFVAADIFANRIYVAGCNTNVNPSPCTVTEINGHTNTIIRTIPITSNPGLGLTGIVVNSLTGHVYVANANDNVVNILDGHRAQLVGSISLNDNSPSAIAINPVLNRLYVPLGNDLTAVVDADRREIITTTTFGTTTVGAAVNVLNGQVYVTDSEDGPSSVGILNRHGSLLTSLTVADSPLGVDVDSFTDLVFVASTALNRITVIDGTTNTVKATVSHVPANYVAVNPATQKVYVSGVTGVTVLTEQ